MSENAKAEALAKKIATKASGALDALEHEMTIMKWPAEFRAIMWGAVAHEAALRQADNEQQVRGEVTQPRDRRD